MKNQRYFYDGLFRKETYASGEYHGNRADWVREIIVKRELQTGHILEIGCGRGHLETIAPKYLGLDISLEAGRYLEKPFVCASTEALPFAGQVFDVVMSFTVLEHLGEPELALAEMDRILKKGGLLIVDAAWRVPPWRPLGLDVKPVKELSVFTKVLKACLPIFNPLWSKGFMRMPLRALRELRFSLTHRFSPLPYTRMQPNWNEFLQRDSDAAASIDNHACALWLHSRGFVSQETGKMSQRVALRCGPLIMVKS